MSAVSHGFSVQDFDYMTVGMLMDALSETIPDGERSLMGTQEDIKRFF